jgi:16S rRNA U516 pseudouridylate synthase RsuA-like enzyme
MEDMRLNKFLAHCGIASRRAADTLIMQGHVTVNGKIVQEMGYRVQPSDVITFKGKPIKKVDKLVYLLLNKPRNVLSTSADERGRKTVLDIIAEKIPERVYPIGRLDRNTSGLIVLTNDGDLTKNFPTPAIKYPRSTRSPWTGIFHLKTWNKSGKGSSSKMARSKLIAFTSWKACQSAKYKSNCTPARTILYVVFLHISNMKWSSWTASIMPASRKRTCHVAGSAH